MKKLFLIIMFLTVSLTAKDFYGDVGYGGINLNMPVWPFHQLITKEYKGWPVIYVDVDKSKRYFEESDPSTEEVNQAGYYELTNNSGIVIRVYLTEGVQGNIYFISVNETFKTKDAAMKQYLIMKGKMFEKYGSADLDNNMEGVIAGVTWSINKKQLVGVDVTKDNGKFILGVTYSDESLESRRNKWFNDRDQAIKSLKYKNDLSKY